MKSVFFLMAATFILISSSVDAGVIYDNGAPNSSQAWFSDVNYSQSMAGDFILNPGANVITDIHWWGVYAYGNVPPQSGDNFTITIYGDQNGLPNNSTIAWSANVGNVTPVDTGMVGSIDNLNIYSYSLDVSPITLTDNTKYYLSIVDDLTGFSSFWAWSVASSTGDSFGTRGITWVEVPNELAFNLTSKVPEPSAFLLFGAGLAGLGLIRMRFKS